jgi:hypothetical protein
MKYPVYLFLLGSLLLAACTPDDSAAKAKLFEEQRAALEKAKTVEKTVQKQAQDQQQNIDKQSGEYPPQ